MAATARPDDATCSIRMLCALARALDEWGHDVDAVLGRAEIRRPDLDDAERRISHAQYEAVWIAAEETTGDPYLGLHLLEQEHATAHDLLVYIASTAPTRREAYERAVRYTRIAHDGLEIVLHEVDGQNVCETRIRGQRDVPVIAQFSVGLIVKMAPRVIGVQPLREVWFRQPEPEDPGEFARVLGLPCRFATPYNAVVAPPVDADGPLPRSDEALCELLEEQAADKLSRVPRGDDFVEQVRGQIAASLTKGDPSAEGVAAALKLSARTLRRRLSAGGVSHQRLLDEVRCELATKALLQRGASVGEVAYLLGFSDASAFHKAFRRWTGKRPSDLLRDG